MAVRYILEKCKTKAAYAAKLQQKGRLDLNKIKTHFEIVLETPILLVVRINGIEIIVHNYGELLFKNCEDLELMRTIADKLYRMGLNTSLTN